MPHAAGRPMSAPGERLSPGALRDAVRARIQATSLRRTAREVGLSPSGLQGFLDGAHSYGPTLHRLREWYVRVQVTVPGPISPDTADAAAHLLTRHVALPERTGAYRRFLQSLASVSGEDPPEWIAELLRDLPPEGPGPR